MTQPNSALVFLEGDIQGPMQLVLDPPVPSDGQGQRLHVGRQAADKVAYLFALLPLDNGLATDTHDTLSAGPVVGDGGRCRHGGVAAPLCSPMILLLRL